MQPQSLPLRPARHRQNPRKEGMPSGVPMSRLPETHQDYGLRADARYGRRNILVPGNGHARGRVTDEKRVTGGPQGNGRATEKRTGRKKRTGYTETSQPQEMGGPQGN